VAASRGNFGLLGIRIGFLRNALDIISALVFNARLAFGDCRYFFEAGVSSNQENEVIATCMRTALSVYRGQGFGGEGLVRTPDCEFAIALSLPPAARLENPSRDALS